MRPLGVAAADAVMTVGIGEPTGPKPRRCLYRWVVSAFLATLLLALPGAIGGCRKEAPESPSQPKRRKNIDGLVPSLPIAHQPLALQRYRMVGHIDRQFGFSPLYGSLMSPLQVLFPQGKSDTVYLYSSAGWDWPSLDGHRGDHILCFVSEGDAARLLYSVRLNMVWFQPPKRTVPVKSMLDFISMLGTGDHPDRTVEGGWPRTWSFALSGQTSRNAKRDLSSQQALVDYWYLSPTDTLYVGRLSSMVGDLAFDRYQAFDTTGDREQWFETYGLPIAECELPAKSRQKSQQK